MLSSALNPLVVSHPLNVKPEVLTATNKVLGDLDPDSFLDHVSKLFPAHSHTGLLTLTPTLQAPSHPCAARNPPPPTDNLTHTPSFLQVSAQRSWLMIHSLPAITLFTFLYAFSWDLPLPSIYFFVCLLECEVLFCSLPFAGPRTACDT